MCAAAAIGAAPFATSAQQGERVRRVGIFSNLSAGDPEARSREAAFIQGLARLGWVEGRNLRIDSRRTAGQRDRVRGLADELVALKPDAVLAATTDLVQALQRASATTPVVFVGAIDPLGSGLIASLSQPAGSATGFVLFEYSLSTKWFELLKEVAPRMTRVAVLRDPALASGIGQFAAIQAVAPIGVALSVISTSGPATIEQAIAGFARDPSGGLIVTASPFASNNAESIAALAARHGLPTISPFRQYVDAGGLMSYGPDYVDQYRRASGYVDRILRGARSADLPVQAPERYELVINLRTARTLGLSLPSALLARADAVIE